MTDSGPRLSLVLELSTPEGEVLEAWDEQDPLDVTLGCGDLPDALEGALTGRPVGEEVDLLLDPADAFGDHDPERVIAIPRDQLEADDEIHKGDWLSVLVDEEDGSEPEEIECRVLDVDEEAVFLDGNHPLAGQAVRFRVRIVAVA